MKLALVTTSDAPFDGVLWSAYQRADGPVPDDIFLLPSRSFRPRWQGLIEPFLLFGPQSLFRIAGSHVLGIPLTQQDREAGLHRSLREVFPEAAYRNVDSLNSTAGLTQLRAVEPDVLVSVGAPEIFEPKVLNIPKVSALNLHNGKLPAFRGVFGTFWELFEGEEYGGVTLHKMEPKVDAGEIVRSAEIELTGDLFEILFQKKQAGGRLLAEHLGGNSSSANNSDPPTSTRSEGEYYSWPSLHEVVRMWLLRIGKSG